MSESKSTAHEHQVKIGRFGFLTILLAIALMVSPLGGQSAQAKSGTDPLEKEYTYDRATEEADIDQTLTDADGTLYRLVAVSQPRVATGFVAAKEHHFVDTRLLAAELHALGKAAIDAQFPYAMRYGEEGYTGTLRRGEVVVVPHYRSVEEQIERTELIGGLATEDTKQLPTNKDYTVASDTGIGAERVVSLERTAVQWQTTGYDADGRPDEFEANVTYRGLERTLVVDYVEATATYRGSVVASADMVSVTATYEPDSVAPATVAPIRIADEALPLAAAFGVLPLVVAATVVVLLAGLLFLLYFFVYKNVRLVQGGTDGRSRVVLRRHIRLCNGEALLTIPATVSLYRAGVTHRVEINRPLAAKDGRIVVVWGGRQIANAHLARTIDLGEELLASVSSEIADMLLREQETEGASTTHTATCQSI